MFQDSRSGPAPGNVEESTPAPGIFQSSSRTEAPQATTTSLGDLISSGEVDIELNVGEGRRLEDLIEDAKFYQDVAINYQNAYEALFAQLAQQAELQDKFEAQSHLMQEASAAIYAAETEAEKHHQELLCIRQDHQKEMDSVVRKIAEQYKVQLTSIQGSLQSWDLEHKLEVQKLQEKIHALEVSLARHGAPNLPSVRVSQQVPSNTALWDEVFNIIPGTVNQHQGAAQYSSQDQAFSFQKQV